VHQRTHVARPSALSSANGVHSSGELVPRIDDLTQPSLGPTATSMSQALARLRALARAYPLAVTFAAAGVAARVVFWVMTDRRFEDALITVKHARNAANGLGLTHHPGEPLTHGFTSAVSVLVPLVGELLHEGSGFLALRLVSLLAFLVAIACAAGIGRRLGVSDWLMVFPLAYLAFDENQIFYGMAGMETQIATAVLLATIYALMSDRVLLVGALLGLALLVRPEFVLLVVPALVYLAIRRRRDAIVAAAMTTLVLFPWVAFTTLYYGSPIPNTIRAKALRYAPDFPALTDPVGWITYSWNQLEELRALRLVWTPFLENNFVVGAPVDVLVLAWAAIAFMTFAVAGAWSGRRVSAWSVAVAYGVLFLLYRIYLLPPDYYVWYVGPFMALAAVAAGGGLALLARVLPRAAIAASVCLAVAFSVHMPFTFVLEQRVQSRVEDRVRKPMAEYLDWVVKPGERVVSESAGYVGYYSNVTLYDYPGLTSPGALHALRALGTERNTLQELTNAVRPEWLIMRPGEWAELEKRFPTTAALYTPVREFKVAWAGHGVEYGGLEYSSFDSDFIVFRRTASA
jgi:hypothetical protein